MAGNNIIGVALTEAQREYVERALADVAIALVSMEELAVASLAHGAQAGGAEANAISNIAKICCHKLDASNQILFGGSCFGWFDDELGSVEGLDVVRDAIAARQQKPLIRRVGQ